jgi:2-polyprenyl-6-methoxyphenol hydroxylase-like FAD-dependent oxidoreductase
VVERLRGGSPLPRAAHFHVRTIELFRAAGIEPAVIEQSAREFLPEGAIIAMDDLSGKKLADIIPSLNVGVDDDLTPCRRLFVSQPGLEPILREKARMAGAGVLEGHEVVGADEDDEGITVTVRDVDSGVEQTRRGALPGGGGRRAQHAAGRARHPLRRAGRLLEQPHHLLHR